VSRLGCRSHLAGRQAAERRRPLEFSDLRLDGGDIRPIQRQRVVGAVVEKCSDRTQSRASGVKVRTENGGTHRRRHEHVPRSARHDPRPPAVLLCVFAVLRSGPNGPDCQVSLHFPPKCEKRPPAFLPRYCLATADHHSQYPVKSACPPYF
jgi:hypothetical protein